MAGGADVAGTVEGELNGGLLVVDGALDRVVRGTVGTLCSEPDSDVHAAADPTNRMTHSPSRHQRNLSGGIPRR